jgi:hypothetical protein
LSLARRKLYVFYVIKNAVELSSGALFEPEGEFEMRRMTRLCTAVLFGVMLTITSGAGALAAGANQPGTGTGTAVGNAIKTAIGIAFPPVASIIQAIWGSHPSDNKKAAQAEPALTNMQRTAGAQIDKLSTDLDVVNTFLVACMEADRHVIKMQDSLGSKDKLTDDEKQSLQGEWNLAKAQIKLLGDDKVKQQANAVTDEFVKRTLLAVQAANLGALDNVQLALDNKNGADLRTRLQDLEPKLSGVTALSGDIINEVSNGLHSAVKAMNPAQGPETPEEQARTKAFQARQKTLSDAINATYGVVAR